MNHKIFILAICCSVALAQQAKQATAGPFIDALNSIGAPKIGYAPGVHQAVANTGAQPNPFNLIPGLNGLGGQGGQPGQFLQAPLQAFGGLAQAGTQAVQGFAQAGGQLFSAAIAPFQQLAQAISNATVSNGQKQGLTGSFLGEILARIGNQTAGLQIRDNLIPTPTS